MAWDTFVQPVIDSYDAYGSGVERVFYRGMQGDYAGAAKAGLGSFLGAASESSYFGPSLIPHGLPLQDPLKASMAEAATRLDPEADGAAAVPYLEFTADVLLEAVTAGTATGALAAKRGATGLKAAVDFSESTARVSGELWGKENIPKLRKFLADRGVGLYENADKFLMAEAKSRGKPGASGAFVPDRGGSPFVVLSHDPTRREVLHELSHYLVWRRYGPEGYASLGEDLREQLVVEMLRNGRNWHRFNPEEQLLELNNYMDHGGGF